MSVSGDNVDEVDNVELPLPWHASVLDDMQKRIEQERLPHAMILSCNPGWGHTELLMSVAARLMGVDDAAVETLAHHDFRWVEPDGAVIKIDQVRKLNEFAAQTVQSSGRKVVAIASAHLLNANAANALLKTLEEPPPATHILLATDTWSRLLPTIRSRCQRFDVLEDHGQARSWLNACGVQVDEAQYAELGRAPLFVVQAAQQPDFGAWLNNLSSNSVPDAVAQVAELDLSVWLARWYRRIIQHLQGESIARIDASARQLISFSEALLSVRRQILESNATNHKLLLEGLISQWLRLTP